MTADRASLLALAEECRSLLIVQIKRGLEIGPADNDAYENKREWTADRGRRADINAPFKCDYWGAAHAAIAVVVEACAKVAEDRRQQFGGDNWRYYDAAAAQIIDALRALGEKEG